MHKFKIKKDYEFVGGNIFYGIYYNEEKKFCLAWDMAFDKGGFDFEQCSIADQDENLDCLIERLYKNTEDVFKEYGFESYDHRLNFKFKKGMKKKYS